MPPSIRCLIAFAAFFAVPAGSEQPRPLAFVSDRLEFESGVFRFGGLRLPLAEPAIPTHLADKPYATLIDSAARVAELDPALVHAVIAVESGYNAAARSPQGAVGLMQVLPLTASRYGVPDPGHSPEHNLRAGTRYLKDLMRLFDGQLELVLAAYNAGESAVIRHGRRVPPYRETRRYVPAVLSKYREMRAPGDAPRPRAGTAARG